MKFAQAIKNLRQLTEYQLRLLGELIYPRCCSVCHGEIEEGCFCERCRQSFGLYKTLGQLEHLDAAILLLKYQQQLQGHIARVKFIGEKNLLPLLSEEAELAVDALYPEIENSFDLITCIPTSKERRLKRGFDVPQELFSFFEGDKWQPNLLKRVFATAPLYDLEPALRRAEVAGCFVVRGDVQGKTILVCDDIFTTGSTMNEAAKALKEAGARRVMALAFTASRDNW